jgi:hypothetical protein
VNKVADFQAMCDTVKPDVIIGSESFLAPEIADSEVFPSEYEPYRADRDRNGGGAFIAISKKYVSAEVPELKTNCELVWAQLNISGSRSVCIGSFYRPPKTECEYLEELNTSLARAANKPNTQIWLGGDFNVPGMDWTSLSVKPGSPQPAVYH